MAITELLGPTVHLSNSTTDHDALRIALLERYRSVRSWTQRITSPLEVEDMVIQTSTECSPTKWQLGHTTWFFETFVLSSIESYQAFHGRYGFLFNSYYNSVGDRVARPIRGLMSRPTVDEVWKYREHVDRAMVHAVERASSTWFSEYAPIIELGIHHEQQHQELMITDVKTVLALNPLRPVYRDRSIDHATTEPLAWTTFDGGLVEIGHTGESFAFDNEAPRHTYYLEPFELANRLITNEEYIHFMQDGGYVNPLLWLSDGWGRVQDEGWSSPMYWERSEGEWYMMTLQGWRRVEPREPVTHISHYEADAFATWSGARLPTEFEWEVAASTTARIEGNFLEDERYHPAPISHNAGASLQQMFGDAWEWTRSAYLPYPGYRAAEGALGEYNGKFMSNQLVLRGGSCVTPRDHIRTTYRNFFPAESRWQFTGIRLARDVH